MCNATLTGVRVTTVAVEKQYVLNTMAACARIIALVIWHANSIFSTQHYTVYVASPVLPYFP